MHRLIFNLLFIGCIANQALAQQGVGMRFGADFNSFTQPTGVSLVQGTFSCLQLEPYLKRYGRHGGYELGLALLIKQGNLPLVMKDFSAGQQTSLSALALDFRAGPRFGIFSPQLGLMGGYRFAYSGFAPSTAPTQSYNRWFASFPLGLSVDLPARFGGVGVGAYYAFGLTNVVKNPPAVAGGDGGTLRAWLLEIHVFISQR